MDNLLIRQTMTWYFMYVFCSLPVAHAYTFDDVKGLREYLFQDHDAAIRPVLNQSKAIQISLSLALFTIVDFDMTNGRLETMGYYTATWKDENLYWNNTQYKDIPSIPVEENKIWSPNIGQLDAIVDENELSAIVLRNDGSALKAVARPYITFCDLDMTNYPVDEHVCSFEFASVNHHSGEMTLVPSTSEIDSTGIKSHGEWKLVNVYVKEISRENQGLQAAAIDFFFVFRRQPGFTILHKSLPLIILGIGDLFVHVVPLNSGERISFSVTVLLAFVFWQAVVVEELPQNSAQISIFSALITASMLISGFTTVTSVILCRIASCDSDRKIPHTLQNLAIRFRMRKNKVEVLEDSTDMGEKTETKTRVNIGQTKSDIHLNHQLCLKDLDDNGKHKDHAIDNEHGDINTSAVNTKSDTDRGNVTWLEVADTIDCFLFMSHLIVLLETMVEMTFNKIEAFITFIALMGNTYVKGYNNTDVVRLKKNILANYDPSIRPLVNQSNPLTVELLLTMTNVIQIDMLNGQLEAVGFLAGVWLDEHLAWDGTEFDDIPRLSLRDNEIWTPDINQFDAIGEEVEKVSVVVEKDGTVLWIVYRRYTTFCILNMRYYPMDEHVCNFEFASSQYTNNELLLVPLAESIDLTFMRDHGEWTVERSSVTEITKTAFGVDVQGVTFTIIFGRQPDFIMLHKAVPLFLLVIANVFVHIVPLNSGERISYAVTILLAFVFWQALVTEDLPQNSSRFSLLSIIMTICIACSTLSTTLSVILCQLTGLKETPVPNSLARLASCFRRREISDCSIRHDIQIKIPPKETVDNGSVYEVESIAGDVNKKQGGESDVTWFEAANAIDRLFLLILAVFKVLFFVGFSLGYVFR